MKRTANPGTHVPTEINSMQYIALAHELRSATFAKFLNVTANRITGTIARGVQWLNSHPVIS